MPGHGCIELNPKKLRALRARLRLELLAKGLMEGSSKYIDVLNRKYSKALYTCL